MALLNFNVRSAGLDEIRLVIDDRGGSSAGQRVQLRRILRPVVVVVVVVIVMDYLIARWHVPVHKQAHRTHGLFDDDLKFPLLLSSTKS